MTGLVSVMCNFAIQVVPLGIRVNAVAHSLSELPKGACFPGPGVALLHRRMPMPR